MIIFKPEWITHSDRGSDSKGKKPCIYSIHVHPDGSRLATGSLDGKVKIWNTKPVYDEHSELDPNCHKLLSTMTMHNGAVLCVRWSNGEGRYLASGSDNDNVIIIWEQDRHASNGSIFGSNDINYETWRAYKYLRGHESDVQDLAWSRDNQYLASCGVDGYVIVWDGSTFDQVKKISQHAGFVKGVTWDPAGKFLATQSDDKMVKIWRTSDWALEADITSPFINAPGTTLFRRLSWSPDGISLAAANAVNGLECIAAIINREDWNADVSLVGHQLPIEVTAFNPKMFYETSFQGDDEEETDEKVMQAICALGSQDRGISIWITKYSRPICVAADVFNNNVYDLAWTPDGRGLFACSHDGTVVCILLNEELLEEVPEEQVLKELAKYGYGRKQTRLPETPAQLQLEEEAIIRSKASKRIVAIMDGTSGNSHSINNRISNIPVDIVSSTSTVPTITEQKVTIGKDGKKRIQPIMLTTSVTPAQPTLQSSSQNLLPQSRMESQERDNASNAMDIDIPNLPKSGVPSCVGGNKIKSDTFDHLDIRVDGTQFLKGKPDWIDSIVAPPIIQKSQTRMALPKVKSHFIIKSNPDDPTTILECHNGKLNSNKQNQLLNIGAKLAASIKGKTIWLDYLSSAILLMTGNTYFSAAACEDGSIHVYTPAGGRYLPPIVMSSTPVVLDCSNQWLLCLTATGLLYTWDVINMQPTLSAVSVAPILQVATTLDSTHHQAPTVTDIRILKDGIPMMITSLHQAFIFHIDMNVWLRISDAWYIISHFWESSDQNPLGWISRLTASPEETDPYTSILLDVGKNDPNAKETITVSHMETQLAVHALIGSRDQYLDCIREYATKLSMENEITKAEELCRWLIGPPVLSLECTEWNPAIMATLTKNEVLNQILPELAKNRQMEGFVNEFTPFI